MQSTHIRGPAPLYLLRKLLLLLTLLLLPSATTVVAHHIVRPASPFRRLTFLLPQAYHQRSGHRPAPLMNMREPTKELTLVFVRRQSPQGGPGEILLGMKKKGFGQGKWNGFGGKVEPGETVEAAVIRELEEEAVVTTTKVERRGMLLFTFQTLPDVLRVHVYEALDFSGQPQETEEMKPQWYSVDQIPYDSMWSDDKYWLPVFLQGKMFDGVFEFDDESIILRHTLKEVQELPPLPPVRPFKA